MLVLLVGTVVPGCGGGEGGPAYTPPPPTPAAFSVSNLSIEPAQAEANETVTISVTVANTGGTQGSHNVVLNINGAQEEAKSVTIAAGSSQSVTFSVSREETGSNTVAVNGLTGSFVIVKPVNFADANLEAAVRGAINKPTGPIYNSDLESLTTLTAQEIGISDLIGLEYCVNLQVLYLQFNNISDISLLAGLINLQSLYLWGNNISDISPLASLTDLQELGINDNNISDISPLSGLTNLQRLYLAANNISDISPLSGLTNLQRLYLWGNSISDISPLAGLTNLQSLYLRVNNISDISPLAGLTDLQELGINDNNISDISPLVENSGLSAGDTVDLRDNPLSITSVNEYIPQLIERGVTVQPAPPLEIGSLAPDFQLQDLDGNTVSLSDLRGSPVMLNFWATWCGPCREEMPYLQQIYDEWQDQGLVILTINLRESQTTVRQFMEDLGLTFPALLDTNGAVTERYNVIAIPTTFFINKYGIIQVIKVGSFSSKQHIEDYFSSILGW